MVEVLREMREMRRQEQRRRRRRGRLTRASRGRAECARTVTRREGDISHMWLWRISSQMVCGSRSLSKAKYLFLRHIDRMRTYKTTRKLIKILVLGSGCRSLWRRTVMSSIGLMVKICKDNKINGNYEPKDIKNWHYINDNRVETY